MELNKIKIGESVNALKEYSTPEALKEFKKAAADIKKIMKHLGDVSGMVDSQETSDKLQELERHLRTFASGAEDLK